MNTLLSEANNPVFAIADTNPDLTVLTSLSGYDDATRAVTLARALQTVRGVREGRSQIWPCAEEKFAEADNRLRGGKLRSLLLISVQATDERAKTTHPVARKT